MFQPCTGCMHAQRAQIDAALRYGEGLRPVARQWGLSKTAVGRHRTRHLEATAAQVETPAPPTAVVVPPVPPRISLLSHRNSNLFVTLPLAP